MERAGTELLSAMYVSLILGGQGTVCATPGTSTFPNSHFLPVRAAGVGDMFQMGMWEEDCASLGRGWGR